MKVKRTLLYVFAGCTGVITTLALARVVVADTLPDDTGLDEQ